MKVESIKDVCRTLADQLSFEANDVFKETGKLHNEKQVVADMLNDIAEYEHETETTDSAES